jgi:hypothetical protein
MSHRNRMIEHSSYAPSGHSVMCGLVTVMGLLNRIDQWGS